MLLHSIRENDATGEYAFGLLRCLMDGRKDWRDAVRRGLKTESQPLRRVLRLLDSKERQIAKVRRYLGGRLEKIEALTIWDVWLADEISDREIELKEDKVLDALGRDAEKTCRLLSYTSCVLTRVDNWIEVAMRLFKEGPESYAFGSVSRHIAVSAMGSARDRILAIANNPNSAGSDLVLSQIVPNMPTVTTDDLTSEAGLRLLRAYCSSEELSLIPSPGSIATERFIQEVVYPFESLHATTDLSRRRIEVLLEHAGQRHDRRYLIKRGHRTTI